MPPGRPGLLHRLGFSMVELLVALALTLLLFGGIVAVFLGSRSTQAANRQLADVQEIGRFALDSMARDLRGAGYAGCNSRPLHVSSSLRAAEADIWDPAHAPIRGYESSEDAEWPHRLFAVTEVDRGSDVLLLRGPVAGSRTLRLERDMTRDTEPLFVSGAQDAGWRVGDVVLAHSCEAHSYFIVSGIEAGTISHAPMPPPEDSDATPASSSTSLGYAFRAGAELTPVEVAMYYVGPSARQPGKSALWRRAGNRQVEIAAGVEQMDLQFGVDADGDDAVEKYLDAHLVEDWSTVRSVSIALAIRTSDESSTDAAAAPQSTEAATDAAQRKRQVFSTVVALRNSAG